MAAYRRGLAFLTALLRLCLANKSVRFLNRPKTPFGNVPTQLKEKNTNIYPFDLISFF